MKLGIVGLPNVGKSTLFNSLTKAGAESANYPFCTIDPNVGIVTVPDERLKLLGDMYHSKKVTPAVIEFVDIAGLVKGASKGEGLGNQFLSNIREVDAIVHVVRCFEDDNVVHVDGNINPLRDIETINLELIFSDIEILERRIAKVGKQARMDKTAAKEAALLERVKALLEEAAFLSLGDQTKTEKLQLEESPSMRSRRVKGPKKLARIVVKVADAKEIESLLAQKPAWTKLYQGEKGYAFEALSPEGDLVLLHAEENRANLQEVTADSEFEKQEDFIGLSQFEIETVEIRVPNANEAQEFYSKIENALDFLTFIEAEGQDLQADNALTWDLTMLKAQVNRLETASLRPVFEGHEIFVPKSDKFLLSQDSSKIELWFEA